MKNINKTIEKIKSEINSIDVKLDRLDDKFNLIQNNRMKNSLSRAIYNCIDQEAIQLQEIDKEIKKLEDKQDHLIKQLKEIRFLIYKAECKKEQKNFENNKYRIRYLLFDENKKTATIIKEIYDNNYKQYITKDINYLNSIGANSINIVEYIDYNNTIKKEINKPYLVTIYQFGHVKVNLLLKTSNNIIYTCIPHQDAHTPYLKKWIDLKGNIVQLIETGYTNQNTEVCTRIIDVWGKESITIHNNFSAYNFLSITKNDNCKTIVDFHSSNKYRIMKKNDIESNIEELIKNTILKLSKNQKYKYNTDAILAILEDNKNKNIA